LAALASGVPPGFVPPEPPLELLELELSVVVAGVLDFWQARRKLRASNDRTGTRRKDFKTHLPI